MVLLSKAATQKSGDSTYVRVYIPIEVVQKLGLSEQNPYIMWTLLHGSVVMAQPFPLNAAREIIAKQSQSTTLKQNKTLPRNRIPIDIDIL